MTATHNRDTLDFASGSIKTLFRKMFIPTLLGMTSMVILFLTDGAFIGHGVGSNALAAVNIASPIFNIMTGIGIMFGIGSSIVASIYLSKDNIQTANINITGGILGGLAISLLVVVIILFNLEDTCRLFGSSEELLPLGSTYLKWIVISLPLQLLGIIAEFGIRLDGSPKFAMICMITGAILNILLDWFLIFQMNLGIAGGAIATSISFSVSGLLSLYYLIFMSKRIKFCFLKFAHRNITLFLKNLYRQIKVGFSALLGELAVSAMIIIGNYIFIYYLGEDGVAAFSVVCYCLPVVFMIANAIVQSIQPVISFAYGRGNIQRIKESRNLAISKALIYGVVISLFFYFGRELLGRIFLPSHSNALKIVTEGLPYYSICGLLTILNIVIIGYYQSIESTTRVTIYTLLRGFIIIIPTYIILPSFLGTIGIWISAAVSELITLIIIIATRQNDVSQNNKSV